MNEAKECPKCRESMLPGYVIDSTRGGVEPSRWVAGIPEKSMLFGLKTDGREQYYIQTIRCRGCGFLESYATADDGGA